MIHSIDRVLNGAIGREQDDQSVGGQRTKFSEGIQSAETRHLEVEKDQIRSLLM